MRKFLSLLCVFSFYAIDSFATIRRVGYNGNQLSGVDYATLALAHTAATSGDTIQIYGSISGGTITKRLVIIGFGYNLDVNTNLQSIGTKAPSNFSNLLLFDIGSENSVIEGCNFGGSENLDIATSNITVRRCYAPYYGIRLRNDLRSFSNTIIESCVASVGMFSSTSLNICTNVQIRNCILYFISFYQTGSNGSILNCVTPSPLSGYQSQINLNAAAFLVKNCIFSVYNSNNVNTIFENNFFGSAQPSQLPSGSNNRWGQVWGNLFNRLGGTSDAIGVYGNAAFAENYYLLAAASPSINAGFDSNNNPTDCGIFGGDSIYRYRPGGVPAVPAIYKLTAPSGSAATANPYNVNIGVRSNN